MKWHRHLVEQLIQALEDTFGETNYHADKVLQWRFKNNRSWGSRDRKFFAESYYDIVRFWRTWVESAGFQWDDHSQLESEDYSKVVAAWAANSHDELPNWDLFSTEAVENYRNNKKNLTSTSSLEAIPDWVHEMGEEVFEKNWKSVVHALNKTASIFLRCNTLKTNAKALQSTLTEEGLKLKVVSGDSLQVLERSNIFTLKSFRSGLFEVQDFGSQSIAPFLQAEPGMRVLDACAGAGGKALHLAALMKNKGKIIATDIHQWKLEELRKRSSRGGIDIIETKVITNKLIKRWDKTFDRLLLDVPCSGIGVLRRNPDTKWKLSPERINELVEIQSTILSNYSKVVKPNGIMVYATCSVLPRENGLQIERFLTENSDWQLQEEKTLLPTDGNHDGFFMARLKRNS